MYKVLFNNREIGVSNLEYGDPPMGIAFGKLIFHDKSFGYKQMKDLCKVYEIEIVNDYSDIKLISTNTIMQLKVINENGKEIKGIGNQITVMNNGENEISIIGIPFQFYEIEFKNHVEEYEKRFNDKQY